MDGDHVSEIAPLQERAHNRANLIAVFRFCYNNNKIIEYILSVL